MSEVIPAGSHDVTEQRETHTPMTMIQIAVEKGADVDQLTKLWELQERFEESQARKAFNEAMTQFKADPPSIFKNKDVSFNNTTYSHATLDHVANQVSEKMSEHGLSFRWDVNQGDSISVTCIVMHCMGHSERVTLSADADKSGSKNSIQAIGSTVTYLQRYTLLAATGLAAKGDDDGHGSESVETISEEQKTVINDLLGEKAATPEKRKKWLEWMKVKAVSDLPATSYDKVVKALGDAK